MKYNLIKFLIIIFFTLSLSGCYSGSQKMMPALADKKMQDETDKTTEEYRAGWKDGCEVGISSGSNTFYKMFYRNNKIDGSVEEFFFHVGRNFLLLQIYIFINRFCCI